MQFEFGQRVQDVISGIDGFVVGRTEYFTGCVHIGFAPGGVDEKGKAKDWEWLDPSRLRLSEKPSVELVAAENLGGPMPNPPQEMRRCRNPCDDPGPRAA